MERENNSFISLVIPTRILGDENITSLEMLLLIIIISLCKKKGYCWATNEYFKKILKVSKQTISKSIGSLSRYNYINLEYELHEKNNSKRKIRISGVLKNEISDIQENLNTSIQENFKQYNKNNYYKRNNIGPEISEDVDGVPLWNKKRCEKEPMSEDELEVLNNWLKCFDDEGDDN